MYAVIRTGGKQYRIIQGETLRVEKLEGEVALFDVIIGHFPSGGVRLCPATLTSDWAPG